MNGESSVTEPRADIVEETYRLVQLAADRGIELRLVGGLAVRLHAPEAGLHPALERAYKDIDFATVKGRGRQVGDFLASVGYEPDQMFNTTNGNRRLLFYDRVHGRQVDVFVGAFEMCHAIPITQRVSLEQVTIPLAELLLTKLQIIELNEKDRRDVLAIVVHHDVGEDDHDAINAAYIAKLCAADWGLWRTCKLNVERVREAVGEYDLSEDDRAAVRDRLDRLWERIEAEPKSTRWRLRDRVGDRVKWYEEPEEVE
jgi:hypothetical protein